MKKHIAGLIFCHFVGIAFGDSAALLQQGASLFNSEPDKAYPLFVQAAEEGNVSAMVAAGLCLENGTGAEINYTKAIEWYEKAVEQNNLKACERLARVYAACLDPKFHDGPKAVKYASALVRKNPRDPEALSLLAAAYARNMDFEKAVQFAGKASDYEVRVKELAEMKCRKEGYKQGEPHPAIATDDWMLRAAQNDSIWAICYVVREAGDQSSPLYNPALAMQLCQKGIGFGVLEMYDRMMKLYLDAGELDKALDCAETVIERCKKNGNTNVLSQEIWLSRWIKGESSVVFSQAEKYREGSSEIREEKVTVADGKPKTYSGFHRCQECSRGYSNPSCENCYYISKTTYNEPPCMRRAYFLYRIAAQKGHAEAQKMLTTMEKDMSAYRWILENEDGTGNVALATALVAEADKYARDDLVPMDLQVAEQLYTKSYLLVPSAEIAYKLALLYLREALDRAIYSRYPNEMGRDVNNAIRWLEQSHSANYSPATRRLIELYACDTDPTSWNGALAVEYAMTLVESCPADDHDARQLLACAYARNGQFLKAKKTMQEAMDLQQAVDEKPDRTYAKKFARFEHGEAWPTTTKPSRSPQSQR